MMREPHVSLILLEQLDHLSKCQRCRIRAMTFQLLLDLIEEAYGLQAVPADRRAAS
jgi:hypothetical protein